MWGMEQFKTYDCGVRLVHEYIKDKKVTNVAFFVASGSGFDLPQKEGIAHYFEHMFFKSTENRTAKQLMVELDRLGGMNNAYTSYDKTCYYGKVTNEDVENIFDILSDCFFHGLFLEKEMETEKGVVCSEIDKYEDDFMDCCIDALNNKMFEGTNFSHPILGSKKSVRSITSNDMKEYREKNNGPGKLVITVIGGISFDKADELVKKYVLPNYKTCEAPSIYGTTYLFVPKINQKIITTQKDTKQVYFVASTPTIRLESPDYLKLQIASIMFGGSMSSRLFERMREKEGIVYYVSSYQDSLALCGNFSSMFITERPTAERAIKAYYDETQKVLNEGFSKTEFANAIHMVKTNLLMKTDNIDAKQQQYANNVLYKNELYNVQKVIENAENIKLDDLNKLFIDVLKKDYVYSLVLSDKNDELLKLLK